MIAMQHRRKAPVKPYRVQLVFTCPDAKKPVHAWPTKTDLDKLVRAVLDGLTNGGIIEDDRHVVALTARKQRGDRTGVNVTVNTSSF